ncbi:hypothetical protein BVY04_00350 [bacterium M21]|nr:hypothetical protein BVY04_00350 [bacterium M21]
MKPDPEKLDADKKEIGQDTVIINKDSIVERYSSLYESLLEMDDTIDGDAGEADILTEDETDFFRNILGRGLDEDRYIVRRQIARGGMGILFSVYDRDFQRHSAMKVLRPDAKKDLSLVRTFVREARITAQLEHPNIVPVHDVGRLAEEGPFFVMKHVHGESLNRIIAHVEREDPEYLEKYNMTAMLEIFRKVCDAIAYAHAKKILHRDIKPHNIMVGDFGEVYLMDWGLAKSIGEVTTELNLAEILGHPSVPGTIVLKGSPGYMSPEQAGRGNQMLDERSDIFLLGSTLYHMFTYFPPYIGTSISNILKSARECDYLHPNEATSSPLQMPEDLSRIIEKCMAMRKQDRYQNVEELIEDVDALIYGKMESQYRMYAAGEALLCEGEEGSECYIIESGKVEIYKEEGGSKIVLNELGPGDILGEMALITHDVRSATAVALEDSEVLVLNDLMFQKNLSRLPMWMNNAVMTLAQRLAKADKQLTKYRNEQDKADSSTN